MTLRRIVLVASIATAVLEAPRSGVSAAGFDWTQWGGPTRNFMSDAKGLASVWPPGGPKKLWTRPLGEGHSSILVDGSRLYTMYRPASAPSDTRRGPQEVVAALDAASGKTIWQFTYAAPTDGLDFSQGVGPHGTPLIVNTRIFATSSRRELFALDKATGKQLWSHDFMKEYGAPSLCFGYRCSPMAYVSTVTATLRGGT